MSVALKVALTIFLMVFIGLELRAQQPSPTPRQIVAAEALQTIKEAQEFLRSSLAPAPVQAICGGMLTNTAALGGQLGEANAARALFLDHHLQLVLKTGSAISSQGYALEEELNRFKSSFMAVRARVNEAQAAWDDAEKARDEICKYEEQALKLRNEIGLAIAITPEQEAANRLKRQQAEAEIESLRKKAIALNGVREAKIRRYTELLRIRIEPLPESEDDPEALSARYLLREEVKDSDVVINEIFVVDQSPIIERQVIRGLGPWSPTVVRNTRLLFLYGWNFPTDRSKLLELASPDPKIKYEVLTFPSEVRSIVSAGSPDRAISSAIRKAEKNLTPERREALRLMDHMLVKAELTGPVGAGFYELRLNGSVGDWRLQYGNIRGKISFVREVGARTADGVREQTEATDRIYLPETVQVEVEMESDMAFDEIAIHLRQNGQLHRVGDSIMTVKARRVPGDTRTFRTSQFNVVKASGERPALPNGGFELVAKHGDHLSAEAADEGFLIAEPLIARAFEPDATGRWRSAVERADKAFPAKDTYGYRIPFSSHDASDALRDQMRRHAVNGSRDVLQDVIFEKTQRRGAKVEALADLRLGHLAAMYMLRDSFIELMEAYKTELAKIDLSDEDALRGFRDTIAPLVHRYGTAFPLSQITVDRRSKLDSFNTPYTVDVTLREVFFGDGRLTTENYLQVWPDGPPSAALRTRRRAADDLWSPYARDPERDLYTMKAARTALEIHRRAVVASLEEARSLSDLNYHGLMQLTGVQFGPVVQHLLPKLMRFDVDRSKWVPDLAARGYVKEIEAVADRFEAQRQVDQAKAQVVVLALGLVPFIPVQTLLLRVMVNGAFALDVVANTIPEHIRRDNELRLSLGTVGVLGPDRLDIAKAERTPDWELYVNIAGAALGVVADLAEVLDKAGAIERGRKFFRSFKGRKIEELRTVPKDTQVDALAALADSRTRQRGSGAVTDEERALSDTLEALATDARREMTAKFEPGFVKPVRRIPPASVATEEEIKVLTGELKQVSVPKHLAKDLELRQLIAEELSSHPVLLKNVSKDDLAFLRNPSKGLTAEQQEAVLRLILDEHHSWHGLKEAFNSKVPRISKLEMYKVINYRTAEVDKILEDAMKAVNQRVKGPPLKRQALGSVTLTSDYDISIGGEGAELVIEEFNKRFRADPRFRGLESGTVFDTNVYTDPVYKLFSSKLSDGTSLRWEPVQYDELKQMMFDLMATRKYMEDAQEWALFRQSALNGAPSADMRRVVEYAVDAAEHATAAAETVLSRELGSPLTEIRKSDTNKLLRATNDAYAKVLNDIHVLRQEAKRLMNIRVGAAAAELPSSRAIQLLGGHDYETMLKKMDTLRQSGVLGSQPAIDALKAEMIELAAKQVRSKQGIALYFASEAYQTEGAIAHVVGELQEAGFAKRITKETLLAGPTDRGRGVTAAQYLNSFSENRANMLKELSHAVDQTTGRFSDARYAAAKGAKYFIRQLDAINQAGIPLKGMVKPELIELTVKIAADKDKLELVAKLLKDASMSPEAYVEAIKDAANEMAIKALSRSPINARANEISRYLKSVDTPGVRPQRP
jgi:hypothetical protein